MSANRVEGQPFDPKDRDKEAVAAQSPTLDDPNNPIPSDLSRLAEIMGKTEEGTTDGDFRDLTQEDYGYIYLWLLWAFTKAGGKL